MCEKRYLFIVAITSQIFLSDSAPSAIKLAAELWYTLLSSAHKYTWRRYYESGNWSAASVNKQNITLIWILPSCKALQKQDTNSGLVVPSEESLLDKWCCVCSVCSNIQYVQTWSWSAPGGLALSLLKNIKHYLELSFRDTTHPKQLSKEGWENHIDTKAIVKFSNTIGLCSWGGCSDCYWYIKCYCCRRCSWSCLHRTAKYLWGWLCSRHKLHVLGIYW